MARILIVEDQPLSAEAVALVCQSARHTVAHAGNGLEALLLLDAQPFDLIITDLVLPKLDGLALTGLVRASRGPHADVPIIGMSRKVAPTLVEMMLRAGMDRVVTKPIHGAILEAMLTTLLAVGRERLTARRARLEASTPDQGEMMGGYWQLS